MAIVTWHRATHYGITRKRAMELEGVKDYPRRSAALFHFDKLTPAEKVTVRKYLRRELADAKAYKKEVWADARKSAATSRALHIKPRQHQAMSPFPKLKKDADEGIKSAEQRLKRYGG